MNWWAAYATWRREVTVYKHVWRTGIAANIIDPILYLGALGLGLGGFIGAIEGRPYWQFIGPGLAASGAMMGATFETTWNSWMRMRENGTYEALLTTPATPAAIALGEMLWGATRAALYSAAVAFVLGAVGLGGVGLLLVPAAGFVGGFVFAGLGLAYTASVARLEFLTAYFTLFVTPLFLFSGIFFPVTELPAWAQRLAWATPLYHIVEVVRDLAYWEVTGLTLVHLGVLAVAGAALAWLASWRVRRFVIV